MKHIYSIYDVKAETFAPPFIAANRTDASRQIAMALMASPTIPPAMYPEDFYLTKLGDWDEVSGLIKPDIVRHFSCVWILRSFARRKDAAEDAAENTAEKAAESEVENA